MKPPPPGPDAADLDAEREEAGHYADLAASLRAWAHSWPARPAEPEAGPGEPEAGT